MIHLDLEEIATGEFLSHLTSQGIPEPSNIAQPRRTFIISKGPSYAFDELLSELGTERFKLHTAWFPGYRSNRDKVPRGKIDLAQYGKELAAQEGHAQKFVVTLNSAKRYLRGKTVSLSDILQFRKAEGGKWVLEYCRIMGANLPRYDVQFEHLTNGPMITTSEQPGNLQACRQIAAILPLEVATQAALTYGLKQ